MTSQHDYITPDWPAPPTVKAYTSTRTHGHSKAPFDEFNLAAHVDDDPTAVQKNRHQLIHALELPHAPTWLNQVHGIAVVTLDDYSGAQPEADAALTRVPNRVCTVLTADCLPLLLCDINGHEVAAVHAGWRGLLAGVIDTTLDALATAPENIVAWLGPAIGPASFEVNADIRAAYIKRDQNNEPAFQLRNESWYGDLYELARINLARRGITRVSGGNLCTYQDNHRFYSYRRAQGPTGRMASLIWIQPQ